MAPKTPRKPRRQNQTSSQQVVQASDYDTEAFYAPPVSRTPSEINFSVVRRYVPSLESIICFANAAQLYLMPEGEWVKESEVEGTLFVCQLTPSPVTGGSRHCIVLLNRKGLDNLIVESGEIQNIEYGVRPGFISLGFKPRVGGRDTEMKILGLHLHANEPSADQICALINEHWEEAVRERIRAGGDDGIHNLGDGLIPNTHGHVEEKSMGRRLSLTELFATAGKP